MTTESFDPSILHIREVNFADPRDCAGIIDVLNSYAADPMGGSAPLAADVRERLVPMLRDHPTSMVLLAFVDGKPSGVAVCFFGLSTFQAKPLVNIHDLAVLPVHRGRGIGRALLEAVEARAVARGCGKITLEVLDENTRAGALYRKFGFDDFSIGTPKQTRFLAKLL